MIWNAFLLALREIRRNLMRAFLTTLGIVIGVSSVITMVTLGNGATQSITTKVQSLGSNLIMIRPIRGMAGTGGRSGGNFKMSDVEAIKQLPNIHAVAPTIQRNARAIYQQNNWSTTVVGTTPDYLTVGAWQLVSGRAFTDSEARVGKALCIIGQTVRKELFVNENPIGSRIRLNKISCEVMGVLGAKGQSSMGMDQDDTIIAPLALVRKQLAGRSSNQDISAILVSADNPQSVDGLVEGISALLRQSRQIAGNEDNDFMVMDTKQISDTLSSTTKILTALLGAVAGVSLLVGGIGIMNIMLVSVTERTREIGIRLAIGALSKEVLLQFLVEAVVLSSLGGLAGILLAFVATYGLSSMLQLPFVFDAKINVIAFVFSAIVGVIFGFMPARRAASLDPIDALRHE